MFFLLSIAQADLLPPPKCKEGTYHVYNMGHHCVKNGYTLVRKDGILVEEKNPETKLVEMPADDPKDEAVKEPNISEETKPEDVPPKKTNPPSTDQPKSNSQSPGCGHLAPTPYAGLILLALWGVGRKRSSDQIS